MQIDEKFMHRAIQLAKNGLGNAHPNPLVGCVIVCENKIIGEGFHQKYGEAHAEVNAINSVENKELLQNSILYVNLEPCSHFGKTPPCTDLILKYNIPKVVVANLDPNPLVAGKGLDKLKKNGIEVITQICEKEGTELNKRFFTFHTKKRPYIILKWAQTVDGFIAKENFDSKWISNSQSRTLVHQWRAEEHAILVGFNTALHDNPSLTTRDVIGKNPIRLILDKNLEIPQSHKVYNQESKTFIFNKLKNEKIENTEFVISNMKIDDLTQKLYELNIQSIIVEGGSNTLQQFINSDTWDEARIFESRNKNFEKGIKAPLISTKFKHIIPILNDNLIYLKSNL